MNKFKSISGLIDVIPACINLYVYLYLYVLLICLCRSVIQNIYVNLPVRLQGF